MKKLIILFAAILLGASATYAGKNSKVTVTYEIILSWYDMNGNFKNSASKGTSSVSFNFYAETPSEARALGEKQCYGTCNVPGYSTISNKGIYQGEGVYKGEKCKVYETRRIIDTSVE